MKQIEFRRWEVRSSASSGALLIGELFFPLNKERKEMNWNQIPMNLIMDH